jgi:DNA polymerase III subunit delta
MAEISPGKLIERIAHGKPIGAVVLIGADIYLRDLCRRKIIEAFVEERSREWGVVRLSARENGWDEVLERATTIPMFVPRQVVIVQDAESVEKLGEERRDGVVAALEEYLGRPSPFTILVLEAEALDGRQRFAKLLKEKALQVELTIGNESAAALTAQMAKDLGASIEADAAALLAEIMNHEPARIGIELEKLAAYAGKKARIGRADVETMVVSARKNTVWQLADMIAARDRKAAFAFLDNLLREGEEPAGIVGALGWMYRKLIEARGLPAHTPGFQAMRQLGMRPESAEAAVRNAHRIPKKGLLGGLAALAEADSQLKSSNPDPRAFLEFLMAQLTAPAASPTNSATNPAAHPARI